MLVTPQANVEAPLSRGHRRIAFFLSADSFESFYGGIFGLDRQRFLREYRNDFVWEYSQGLIDEGHSVVIYIISYGKPEIVQVAPHLSVRFLPLPKWFRPLDAVTYRLARLGLFRTLRDKLRFRTYRSALADSLRQDRIDVLYHQDVWTPRFDLVVSWVNVPVIGAEHGAVYESWMARDKRKSIKKAVHITCQSRDALERVKQFQGHGSLLPNAVDARFFHPSTRANKQPKTILSVGRLVEDQKRFIDLLSALSLLPDFKLRLVGSGPDEHLLKRKVDVLGLNERVEFLGFISDRHKLLQLYQTSEIFVSSSAWEGVALVVLEAMSCEMSTVCSRIPTFEELIEHETNGLLFNVGNVEQLAQMIGLAHEIRTFGIEARRTILSRYSSAKLYRELSDLVLMATPKA